MRQWEETVQKILVSADGVCVSGLPEAEVEAALFGIMNRLVT